MLAGHVALLDHFSREIFNRSYTPDISALRQQVLALAVANNYPTAVSGFVRLALNGNGEESLTAIGTSLYDGYALRSLTPDAASVIYDLPFGEVPTSAHEVVADLANQFAQRHGAQIAIRCDRDGCFRSVGTAPIFAVQGYAVLTSPAEITADGVPTKSSVERELIAQAVRALGWELREEPFGRADLPQLDELFFADHRGITALAHCDGQPLMSLVAERIAMAMEQLFPKK